MRATYSTELHLCNNKLTRTMTYSMIEDAGLTNMLAAQLLHWLVGNSTAPAQASCPCLLLLPLPAFGLPVVVRTALS
jgi:hypothetical protein